MAASASPIGSAAFALCLVASGSLYVASLRVRAQALRDDTPRDLQIFRDLCFGSIMGFMSCRSAQMMVGSLDGTVGRDDGNDCNGQPLTPLVLLFGMLADVFLGTSVLDRRWTAFCSSTGLVMAAAIPHILWRSGVPEHTHGADRYPTERWLSTLLAALGSLMAIGLGAIEGGALSAAWGSARTGTRRSGARGATFGSLYDLERERRCHCSLGLSDLLGLSGRSGSTRYAPAAAEAEADPPSAPAGVHVEMMSPAAPRGEPRPRSELLRTSEPVGQAPWSPPELRFQEAVVVGQAIGGGAGAGSEECDSR